MNRQESYPSGFKCRKWTLVALICIDLLTLIILTVTLVNRHVNGGDTDMDNINGTSRIPTLNQLTNAVNTVGDNLQKLNITSKINVDLGTLGNNATREFLDNILNKARDNEGTTKWVSQIIAMVLGFIICIIGLVGVLTEHYCLTITYAAFTFLGLLYTILVGILSAEPVFTAKIIMYILFLIIVVWFIIDLRSIRRQKSQNI